MNDGPKSLIEDADTESLKRKLDHLPGAYSVPTQQQKRANFDETDEMDEKRKKVSDKHREINRLSAARSRMRKKMHQFALEQTNDFLRQRNNALSAKIKINQKKNAGLRVENKDLLRSNKDFLQRFLSNVQRRNLDLRDADFKNAIDMQSFARRVLLPNSVPMAALEKDAATHTPDLIPESSQVVASETSSQTQMIPKDAHLATGLAVNILTASDPGGLFDRPMKLPTDIPNAEATSVFAGSKLPRLFRQITNHLRARCADVPT